MSDFKEIKTQEEFDAAISERLKRERDTLSKKYEGYLSPEDAKKEKDGLQAKIDDLNQKLNDANEKISAHDKELAEKDATIKKHETASVKARIAHEAGLPYEAIGFIGGDDEKTIKESAASLKAIIGTKKVPPLSQNEDDKGDKDAALLGTLRGLNERGE